MVSEPQGERKKEASLSGNYAGKYYIVAALLLK